jgi:hypothetical protein
MGCLVRAVPRTQHTDHACLDASERGSLAIDIGPCLVCLSKLVCQYACEEDDSTGTDSRVSSSMRCELSILPLSASKDSDAEDLYALHILLGSHGERRGSAYSISFRTPDKRVA